MTQVAYRRATTTRVKADLRVDIDDGDSQLHLELTGDGSELLLKVSDPSAFAGSRDAQGVRDVAEMLARAGITVHVEDDRGSRLLTIGDVRAPWWQVVFTRTRHLRVRAGRGLLAAARGRADRDQQLLPSGGLGVPPTPLPIAPTFLRRPVKKVRSTDSPWGGGGPRLVLVPTDGVYRAELPTYWLQQEVTTIGSDPDCDIVLTGLAAHHAEVRHEGGDEYVLVAIDPRTRVFGERVGQRLLRTSSRVELGEHTLSFVREEFADHGRPHGGRVGGELGRQRTQHGQD